MSEEEKQPNNSFSFSIRNHLKADLARDSTENGFVYRDEPIREIEYEIDGKKVTKWQRILNNRWVDDDDDDD